MTRLVTFCVVTLKPNYDVLLDSFIILYFCVKLCPDKRMPPPPPPCARVWILSGSVHGAWVGSEDPSVRLGTHEQRCDTSTCSFLHTSSKSETFCWQFGKHQQYINLIAQVSGHLNSPFKVVDSIKRHSSTRRIGTHAHRNAAFVLNR